MSSRLTNKFANKVSNTFNVSKEQLALHSTIITVIYNVLVIGYLLALENNKCACIRDWRHDFIKYYAICVVLWSVLCCCVVVSTKSEVAMLISDLLMFAGLISLWCLYTYVGDLDKSRCSCAVEKQKNMHYFLYIYRYVPVILIVITLIGIIYKTLKSM